MTAILQTEVQLGRQGRLVIPAKLRRVMSIEAGVLLIARVEHGRLILQKRENFRDRLRSRFSVIRADINLADELIAERRAKLAKTPPHEHRPACIGASCLSP